MGPPLDRQHVSLIVGEGHNIQYTWHEREQSSTAAVLPTKHDCADTTVTVL